jgi:hypothetical protein
MVALKHLTPHCVIFLSDIPFRDLQKVLSISYFAAILMFVFLRESLSFATVLAL